MSSVIKTYNDVLFLENHSNTYIMYWSMKINGLYEGVCGEYNCLKEAIKAYYIELRQVVILKESK